MSERMLDRACRHPSGSRAPARFGANGSGMIDRPANWMIDDSSSSVAVQLLAKDASFARELPYNCTRVRARVRTSFARRGPTCEAREENMLASVSLASLKRAYANILRVHAVCFPVPIVGSWMKTISRV